MNAYRTASYVGFVLTILGLAILVYAAYFLLALQDLDLNGIKVKGKVIDISQKAIYRSPVVSFQTKEGQTRTFISDLDQNKDMFHYQIGQEVEVIYHKDNPNNARINNFWERNFGQIFLGIFGGFLCSFGFFVRWQFLRKAKRYD
jgi:hypothetical protein